MGNRVPRRRDEAARSIALAWLVAVLAGCTGPEDAPQITGLVVWDQVEVVAPASERIVEIQVQEGDRVQPGQLLVQLDTERAMRALAAAEAEVAEHLARWQQLAHGARVEDIDAARASVSARRAEARDAALELARRRKLLVRKLISPAEVDSAQARLDSAAARVKESRARLAALESGSRPEEVEAARAALEAARARAEERKFALRELTLAADRGGRVDRVLVEVGDRPRSGEVLITQWVGKTPRIRLYVPEPLLAGMRRGQRFRLHLDGRAETPEAELTWLSTEPVFTPYFALNERDRHYLSYLAELRLDEPLYLPSGLPVTAEAAE